MVRSPNHVRDAKLREARRWLRGILVGMSVGGRSKPPVSPKGANRALRLAARRLVKFTELA